MKDHRSDHTATVLTSPECETTSAPSFCGKVLVVSGVQGRDTPGQFTDNVHSVELYDPKTGTWTACARGAGNSGCPEPLSVPLYTHGAAVISGTNCAPRCGWVMVAGGSTIEVVNPGPNDRGRYAELYNPATGRWTRTAIPNELINERPVSLDPSLTALPSGKVLVVGRDDPLVSQPGLIYDPTRNAWSTTAGPNVGARVGRQFAVLLSEPDCGPHCGKVLIGGGGGSRTNETLAEFYDPAIDAFTPAPSMPVRASAPDAVLLPDGKVMVSGNMDDKRSQIFDPARSEWTITGPMQVQRSGPHLVRMPNGQVLSAGGNTSDPTTEVFRPEGTGSEGGVWEASGTMSEPRDQAALVPLTCAAREGRALIAGGTKAFPGPNNQTLYYSLDSAELYTAVPQITGVESGAGPLSGSRFKLRGERLRASQPAGVAVHIGQVPATEVSVNPQGTEITALAPVASSPGPAPVSVTIDGTPAETCGMDLVFTYLPPPSITSLNPPQGLAVGGTTVTLTGSGLAPDSSVRFGSEPARNVRVAGDGKSITAQAPPNNPGEVPVVVSSAGGEVQAAFKYLPAITGVVPDSGPTEGGTTVTIAGKGFTGARTVTFDGIETTPERVTDGAITVKSPPHHPGQVALGVDVPPHGQAIPVSAGVHKFTYGASPVAPAGGAGESLAGTSGSLTPTSQGPTTTGGGPAASGGSPPPPPAQTPPVPILSQSPVSAFEPGSAAMPGPAAMESGSAVPLQTPAGVQVPGAAGSQASAPLPALVSVPDFVPDPAEQYAMVGFSASGSGAGVLPLGAGVVALALCGGMFLGRRSDETSPRARPQEAY